MRTRSNPLLSPHMVSALSIEGADFFVHFAQRFEPGASECGARYFVYFVHFS